jgi:putative oxidoreductase
MKDYGAPVGRLLLALIFIIAGWNKIPGFEKTAAYMASKGLPIVNVLLVLAILIELGGGLMIVLGWYARWAALAIFLFLIPVTIIFHPFWADPEQFNSFFKNLAIMGGMAYIMAFGAGKFSLENES